MPVVRRFNECLLTVRNAFGMDSHVDLGRQGVIRVLDQLHHGNHIVGDEIPAQRGDCPSVDAEWNRRGWLRFDPKVPGLDHDRPGLALHRRMAAWHLAGLSSLRDCSLVAMVRGVSCPIKARLGKAPAGESRIAGKRRAASVPSDRRTWPAPAFEPVWRRTRLATAPCKPREPADRCGAGEIPGLARTSCGWFTHRCARSRPQHLCRRTHAWNCWTPGGKMHGRHQELSLPASHPARQPRVPTITSPLRLLRAATGTIQHRPSSGHASPNGLLAMA